MLGFLFLFFWILLYCKAPQKTCAMVAPRAPPVAACCGQDSWKHASLGVQLYFSHHISSTWEE